MVDVFEWVWCEVQLGDGLFGWCVGERGEVWFGFCLDRRGFVELL